MTSLTLYVNDKEAYQYNVEQEPDEQQQAFLDKMDTDMARGIRVYGELFTQPDAEQRQHFVAMNLLKGLQQGNEAVVASSCAYLVSRQPDLSGIYAYDEGDKVRLEFSQKD